jgi:Rps23 Pro-64 3,4-dihydroxylase Tpa1-like proline 4-hydroxylase
MYDKILDYLNRGIDPFLPNSVENDIKVIDDLFPYNYLFSLYTKTVNSRYTCHHVSDRFSKDANFTSRFSCILSKDDFINTGLIPYMQKIANGLGQDLFLFEYYIGHYTKSTTSSSHVDNTKPDTITILIYPNIEWEDIWAGDIKFYSEDSPFNKTVEFKPGRVIIFDSRIRHKVMPLSSMAGLDRFSFSIKACTFLGLPKYATDNIQNIIHIPCT